MRQNLFDRLARLTGNYPWFVLLGALVLTVISVGLSEDLRMETRVLDLLPADDPAARGLRPRARSRRGRD